MTDRLKAAAAALEANIKIVRTTNGDASTAADDTYCSVLGGDAGEVETEAARAVHAILADIEARHDLLKAAVEVREAALAALRV